MAPSRCPGTDDVQARVRRLLGTHAPTGSPTERLVAEGTVVAADGRYRLTLSVRTGRQGSEAVTRIFDSGSCESLAGAAAVTLALLARGGASSDGPASPVSPGAPAPSQPPSAAPPAASAPGAVSATSPSADSPPAAAPFAPPSAASAAPSPATTPPASAPTDAHAREEAAESPPAATAEFPAIPGKFALEAPLLAVDAGVLPGSAYGVGVGAGVRVNQLRVRMAGLLWLSQSGTNAAPYEANYQRRTGELSGCYSWPGGSFEVGPCLAVALEDVTVGSSGPDVVGGPGHVAWLTVGVAVRAGWSLRRWATLFVRPGVTLATSRPIFAIDGVGPLYQVPRAAGGVEVGSEWIF